MHLPNKKHHWISLLAALCLTSQVVGVYAGNNVDVEPPTYEHVQAHIDHLNSNSEDLPDLEVPQKMYFGDFIYQLDQVLLLKDHEVERERPDQLFVMVYTVVNDNPEKVDQYARIWHNQVVLSTQTADFLQVLPISDQPVPEVYQEDRDTYHLLTLYPTPAEATEIYVSIFDDEGVHDAVINLQELAAQPPYWGLYVNESQPLRAYLFDGPWLYLVYQPGTVPDSLIDLPGVSLMTWEDVTLSSKAQDFLDQGDFVPGGSDQILAFKPLAYERQEGKIQGVLDETGSAILEFIGLEDWQALEDGDGHRYVLASPSAENAHAPSQEASLSSDQAPEAGQTPEEASGLHKALDLFRSVNPDRVVYAEDAYYDPDVDGYRIPTDMGTFLVFAGGDIHSPEGDVFNRNVNYFPSNLQSVIDILASYRGSDEGIDFSSITYDQASDSYSVLTPEGSYQVYLDGHVRGPE